MTELRVLDEVDGLIAVDKPAGLLVIPGRSPEGGASARELLEEQLKRRVFVVHRLDRDTTGVLLFALTPEAHRAASMAFENGQVQKQYLALVQGVLSEPRSVDVPLIPARRGRMRPARPSEEGKDSKTVLTPVETFARATLVRASPLTGRTHQIRVHLLAIGHPLLVDPQYGQPDFQTAKDLGGEGDAKVLERTPLHAAEVQLPELPGIKGRTFTSPVPSDMGRALEILRSRSPA